MAEKEKEGQEGKDGEAFNELRRVQLHERRNAALSKVKEDFFQECGRQLEKIKASGEDARELANYESVLRSVIEAREQKILWKAFRDLNAGAGAISSEGLAREEKQLYTELVKLLNEFKSSLNAGADLGAGANPVKESRQTVAGKKPRIVEARERKAEEAREAKEAKKFVVKFLMDLPRFPWSDSTDYGPFERGQVIELNGELAEYLAGRKAVEVIKRH